MCVHPVGPDDCCFGKPESTAVDEGSVGDKTSDKSTNDITLTNHSDTTISQRTVQDVVTTSTACASEVIVDTHCSEATTFVKTTSDVTSVVHDDTSRDILTMIL